MFPLALFLPAVPHGSSILLVALLLLPPSVLCCFLWGISLPVRFFTFCFGSSLVVFSACWVSLPCVLRMLLFLASHGYVPTFFWFPSLVTRSNLSSFAMGSSLRAESPLSVVRAFFLRGSLLVCISWYPFSYVPISLLPSSRGVSSPLLRQVFPEVSLPPFFADWHSRLCCCVSTSSFMWLSPLQGFFLILSSPVGGFLLFSFHIVAVRL